MHVASSINFCWFYSNSKSITLFLISAQSFVSHLSELSATGQPKDELFLLLTLEFFSFGCQPLFWGCGLLWLSCVTSVSHNSAFTDYSSSFIDRFFYSASLEKLVGPRRFEMDRHYYRDQQKTWSWYLKNSQFDEYTSDDLNPEVLEEPSIVISFECCQPAMLPLLDTCNGEFSFQLFNTFDQMMILQCRIFIAKFE